MKDFIKWLGVNEKVAKVGFWIFIFMVFLIIFNTFLESVGLPFYKITYENLSRIKINETLEYLVSWLTLFVGFYVMVLLVFRVKEAKSILKYAIIYVAINILLSLLTSEIILQMFTFLYVLGFCYIYSNKNAKYILYGIGTCIFTAIIQFICYSYKIRFIDFESLNHITKNLLGLDYFIITFVIILLKEKYLNKKQNTKSEKF